MSDTLENTKRPVGRPPFKPTKDHREQVEMMAGRGLPKNFICALIGIDDWTLDKYFSHELVSGRAKTAMRVGEKMIEKALDGDTQALIWYTKAQLGWKDQSRIEVTGADSGPVQIETIKRVVVNAKKDSNT